MSPVAGWFVGVGGSSPLRRRVEVDVAWLTAGGLVDNATHDDGVGTLGLARGATVTVRP